MSVIIVGLGIGRPVAAQTVTPGSPAMPVSTGKVTRANVPILFRNIGAVQAYQSVLVRARVDGTLDKYFVAEGQDVKRGDKLAQIDPRPYAAALAAAQAKKASDDAQLANAQRDEARYASLARSDFASRQQLDTQTAMVAQLRATLQGDDAAIAASQLNLDFTTITSPIDGRTGLRLVDAGNLVHATDATGLITLTQIRPIAVTFTLPQDSLPFIQEAMAGHELPVTAYSSDDQTELAVGQLATTDNMIDSATGTIKLKAVFANATTKLWPGQFVNVRLQVGVRSNALVMPTAAVQLGPDGPYTYVVKPNSTVALQPVKVVQDDGQVTVIGSGVDLGSEVVTNGQSRLQNGTAVTIVAPKANS
jgi:multidrug efflux system membrane fusion protein